MGIQLSRRPTTEEIEQICIATDEAARRVLFNRISLKLMSDLDVTVEASGDKPLVLDVDIGVELLVRDENLQALVDRATDAALLAADAKVRELDLCADTQA